MLVSVCLVAGLCHPIFFYEQHQFVTPSLSVRLSLCVFVSLCLFPPTPPPPFLCPTRSCMYARARFAFCFVFILSSSWLKWYCTVRLKLKLSQYYHTSVRDEYSVLVTSETSVFTGQSYVRSTERLVDGWLICGTWEKWKDPSIYLSDIDQNWK